jgi:uncharacterized membrane protein YkoI
MRDRLVAACGAAVLAAGFACSLPCSGQDKGEKEEDGKDQDDEEFEALLKVLPKSRLSLAEGIRQAAAKDPETAISAKFEMGDDGRLSLSVYTAGKGLGVEAEENVLQEKSGSPEGEKWAPGVEVFKDVEHVARSAQQATLMALSPCSLLDVVAKAEKRQAGTVFSAKPEMDGRKARIEVLVASGGKVVEVVYDALTGNEVAAEPEHKAMR